MLFKIVFRALLRNPFRTFLTSGAAALCVVAFLILRAVSVGWVAREAHVPNDFYTRHYLTLGARFPIKTLPKVASQPFVAHASPFLVFSVESPKRAGETIGGGAVEPKAFLEVRRPTSMAVDPGVAQRWFETRDGVLVGDKLAVQEGWKAGDVVSLRSPLFPLPEGELWKFTVVGTYHATSSLDYGDLIYVHYDYVNTALAGETRDLTNGIVFSCKQGTPMENVPKMIDGLLAEDFPSLTQDVVSAGRSLEGMFGAFFLVLDSLSTLFVVIVAMLLVNTVTLGVRERTSQYAVLTALGFSRKYLTALIASESVLIAALGAALGCAVSDVLINRTVGPALLAAGSGLPAMELSKGTVLATLAGSVVVGLVAAIPAVVSVIRRKLTEALRFTG